MCFVYILYNFKDTPENFYYRVREVMKCGGTGYPMRFHPFNDLDRQYVGKHWIHDLRNNVNRLTNRLGQISEGSKRNFEYIWGRNAKEFIENISMSRKVFNKRIIEKRESVRINRIREVR